MAYSRPYPAPPQAYVGPAAPALPRPAQPVPTSVPVPPGTLPPGTIVNVGDYQVTVDKFLSEGGFAHVYLATSAVPLPIGSPRATTKHVLKRMAVPDKRGVHEVGKEVEVMRQLKDHPKIVNMIEASVADLPGGVDGSKGYEIYILMEWCAGGGIIDMMNTRLQNRMTESEILKIFADTVEAVAHMHYQSPPLIHRDLKVENILLTPPQTYKLCDFGSTTKPLPRANVPTSVEGIQKIELDINKTTTLQYRAPELVDVWGRKGYDEKIDIWALGVLLYKLCYYTTPFEENGPLAILNAQYKFLPYPAYSPQIRSLISSMLQERAEARPNIYQVHEMTCRLRGVPIRIENKYAAESVIPGDVRLQQPRAAALSRPSSAQPPAVAPSTTDILSHQQGSASSPDLTKLAGMQGLASQVSPMRRGRPGKSVTANGGGSKDGWAAFTSPEPVSTAAEGASGFRDSFTPEVASKESKSPEIPLATEVEVPQNMGMFQDLLSSKASAVAPTQQKEEEHKGKDDDEERKRFESTFPALLDDDLAPFGPTTQLTSQAQSQVQLKVKDQPTPAIVTSPRLVAPDLTGEGPPLPRRPPGSSSPAIPSLPSSRINEGAYQTSPDSAKPTHPTDRPRFVERGSQTSPHLLASWKNGSTPSNSSTAPQSSQPSQSNTNGRSGLRQSSIPEFNLSSPGSDANTKAPTFDLLGDDDDHRLDSFVPGTVLSQPSLSQQSLQSRSPIAPTKPSPDNDQSFASKRMSFASSAPLPRGEEKEREKFKPVRKSIPGDDGIEVSKDGINNRTQIMEEERPSLEGDLVEHRFPALTDASVPETAPTRLEREFEDVVERREEGPDSSDDDKETPIMVTKIGKPAFSDDEDFSPRPIKQKAATVPSRPTFGARVSSQQSLLSTTNRLSLAASPTPLETRNGSTESLPVTMPKPNRQNTLSSVSSSEGGGDIDLGPALASIRRFAPDGNMNPQDSILDERAENHTPTKEEVSASTLPTLSTDDLSPRTTLPPLTSSVGPVPTPLLSTSTSSTSGFVPNRPGSAQPPLLAPKPRKAGALNSLVSRYEGLGTTLTGGPPPVGSKPVGLRKDSTGSNASLGRDAVNPRPLPTRAPSHTSSIHTDGATTSNWRGATSDPGGRDQLPEEGRTPEGSSSIPVSSTVKPSTPTQPAPRLPFKPVPPSVSPQATTTRSRYSIAGPPPPPSTAFVPRPNSNSSSSTHALALTQDDNDDQEEEEKFAGVRNMKSRWESMAAKPKEEQPGRGPGHHQRKSWAQV